MVLLGSNLSSTYLYANYLLTMHENRKADEKLVLAIRRNTLSLARSALVKTVQAVQAAMPNVCHKSPAVPFNPPDSPPLVSFSAAPTTSSASCSRST